MNNNIDELGCSNAGENGWSEANSGCLSYSKYKRLLASAEVDTGVLCIDVYRRFQRGRHKSCMCSVVHYYYLRIAILWTEVDAGANVYIICSGL